MPSFRSYSHTFAQFRDNRPVARLAGPSIAVLGWIPFVGMVQKGWKRESWFSRQQWGAKFMLQSGNPEPPECRSRQEFQEYLNKREFRGALALDSVSALLDEAGTVIGTRFEHFAGAGYTPLRVSPRTPRVLCAGYGESDFAVISQNGYLSIEFWYSFKMGKSVDLTNYLVTGARAASATIHLVYTFQPGGSVQIDINGSAIPSQCAILDWRDRQRIYDMMRASDSEFSAFFKAGKCVTAPIRERYSFHEHARRQSLVETL